MQRNLFEIRVIYKRVLTTVWVHGTRNLESQTQQVLVMIHYLKNKVGVVDFANAQGVVMF